MTRVEFGADDQYSGEHWYAVYTKSHQEKLVKELLESRNIEVFLPTLKMITWPYGSIPSEKPFFPRYLFSRLDLQRVPLSSINWMPGVSTVVGFDGQPVAVPDGVIDWLRRSWVSLGVDSLLGASSPQAGDRLRVKAGPLKGMEAIFDRRLSAEGRARVLVQILGRLAACEVELSCLERL